MKVENFTLKLDSQHSKTQTKTTQFSQELRAVNSSYLEEIESISQNMQRLQFALIQQFIYSLQGRQTSQVNLNKEFTQSDVTLTQEVLIQERLDVQMMGCIQTDTQKIDINIDISFSSSFVQKHQLLKTQFYDPLVLNFDGLLPDLETEKFSFDIDCDGESDQLSMLRNGSGFLVLDKNKNGKVDDGSELFGAHNGNGFYDLRRYDSDNNGWIDENDPIMDGLRIWSKNTQEDKLVALAELGVGALYLGYSANPFEIKSSENEVLGKVRANGLYLNEDGTSGVMSQIDFARKTQEDLPEQKESELLTHLLKIS